MLQREPPICKAWTEILKPTSQLLRQLLVSLAGVATTVSRRGPLGRILKVAEIDDEWGR
jgi:hypothetical protein